MIQRTTKRSTRVHQKTRKPKQPRQRARFLTSSVRSTSRRRPSRHGQPTRGSVKGWAKTGMLAMQSHDGFIVSNLHIAIRAAARAVGAASFDFCAITGDISTNATSRERFTFAKQYLTNKIAVSETFQVGLGIEPRKLFCVPGNHDKMLLLSPEFYLSEFGTLPAPPPYMVKLDGQSGRQFVFLGPRLQFIRGRQHRGGLRFAREPCLVGRAAGTARPR